MIQKAILSIIIFGLIFSPAYAQTNYNPGIVKPDSPLWQMDLAMERLFESIQLNTNSRIELQLRHADERIGEMQYVNENQLSNVVTEYNAVLNRIQANENIQYKEAVQIQSKIQAHNDVIGVFERDGSEQVRATITTASQTNTELQNQVQSRQQSIQTEQMKWWQEFSSKYPISDMPVSVFNMLDTDMDTLKEIVPDGITQIKIIQEDGSAVNEYIIKNTGTDIQISRGKTTNPTQSYTFTIQEIQNYKNRYGSMVGL